MATAKAGPDGKVSSELLDYYAEKTQGGYISLVIIEHSFISAEGKASAKQLSVAEDSMIEGLNKLAKVIHLNGSKTVMQINHAGGATTRELTGKIPVAPSAIVNQRSQAIPHELTHQEIAAIIQSFAEAARRTKEAGFDGVEIHSAHGFLLNQFFSPLTNKRNDEYGGDVKNRIRIHLQVIEAVKTAVGDNFPVLLRLGASDYMPGGTTIEDSLVAVPEFARAGVSIIDVSGGLCKYNVPGLTGQGFFAPLTEALKKVISIPIILTGGVTEAESAEQLLVEGKADLIGVGRAILSNSKWAEQAITSLRH
jgi:2,4-dienoyl-CoA reductase-like NADH-dependent reductase (Old Yellow Enzyme family)